MKKFLRRLHNIWLWIIAIVFTLAGLCAFIAFIGVLSIKIHRALM